MKLRIKETGELLEDVKFIDTTLNKIIIQYLDNGILRECTIKNLSDIEEVKDYEEPQEHYFITEYGGVYSLNEYDGFNNVANVDEYKQIGNYFETKEEAERTVEKLKALKRLKDKGFESYKSNICGDDFVVIFKLTNHVDYGQSMNDFDCIFDFGGKE